MGQATAVAAHHQGHLGRRAGAVHGGHHLVLAPLPVLDGVPVDVQDKVDGGILGQIALDGRQGAVIGSGVGGIVVQRPVMEDGDARLSKDLRHHIPHLYHVVAGVRGPVVAGPDDLRAFRGSVGLAAVAVDDQNLGFFSGQLRGKGLLQVRNGQGVVRGIADVGPAADGVAAGVCGHQGLGGDAVVGGGGGVQGRLL